MVPEKEIQHIFQVGADSDYPTITAALEAAVPLLLQGEGVKVVIHPGIYRETARVEIPFGQSSGVLVLEASLPGEVIIRGSEVFDGWKIRGRNVFHRSWPYRWGDGGEGLIGRREMLFIRDVRLTQVNPAPAIRGGQFYVDEERGEIGMLPPAKAVVVPGAVEVATDRLAPGFTFINMDGLVIRGLLFQRHATGTEEAPATLNILRCGDVILENVLVEHSNAMGISLRECTRVSMKRVFVKRNGRIGLQIADCFDVIIQGLEAELNGWRFFRTQRKAEDDGAIQLIRNSNVLMEVVRCTDNHNGGVCIRGQENITVRRLFAASNEKYGLKAESNLYLMLTTSEIVRNNPTGVYSRGNLFMGSSILAHNGKAGVGRQLWLEGGEDGEKPQIAWSLCMMSSGLEKSLLVQAAPQLILSNAIMASQNLYYSSESEDVFGIGNRRYSFSEWQLMTGEDLDSLYDDPIFVDPNRFDYVVRPESPWYSRDSWPVRALTEEDKVLATEMRDGLSSALVDTNE